MHSVCEGMGGLHTSRRCALCDVTIECSGKVDVLRVCLPKYAYVGRLKIVEERCKL
jgi:hypothetical protein